MSSKINQTSKIASGFPSHSRLPSSRCRPHFYQVSDQQVSSSILPNRDSSAASPADAVHAQETHRKVEPGQQYSHIIIVRLWISLVFSRGRRKIGPSCHVKNEQQLIYFGFKILLFLIVVQSKVTHTKCLRPKPVYELFLKQFSSEAIKFG